MDQCTHEVRLQYWKNIITQCQSRPAGQTVKQWMAEHGINAKTYYLWQRKIRQETFALIQKPSQTLLTKEEKETCFAELPIPQTVQQELSIRPVAVIKTSSCTIALSDEIPDTLLAQILREVAHA